VKPGTGKVSIITGAYGAIGKAIARQMAEQDYRAVLVGRDESKLEKAAEEIIRQTGNRNVEHKVVDLSLQSSIKAFATQWKEPLHVLINNAAGCPRRRTETAEGIEFQFATNVLGYFWMIRYFSEFMKNPGGARIINVASYWAGGLDLEDPEFRKRRYDNDAAYRQSKQADRMLAIAFAELLKPSGITVNACHPGDVNSKLSNVWLATAEEVKNVTGRYFSDKNESVCEFARDKKSIEKLFSLCQRY
jgi:retinol dehydrogenase-13